MLKTKKATTTLLSGIIILAAGIIFVLCNNTITGKGIVTAAGILFLLSGIINTVLYLGAKNDDGKPRHSGASKIFGLIVSIAALLLGLSMFIFTSDFVNLIPMMFGILMIIGTIIQLYIIAIASRPVQMPLWSYIFPGIILLLSIVVLATNLSEPTLMTLAGLSFIIFGIAGFVEAYIIATERRRLDKMQDVANTHKAIEDIATTDVKEIKALDD